MELNNDNEFEDTSDDNDREFETPDDEEQEDGFVELTNEAYDRLSLNDQRRYRVQLESFKKSLKREAARSRKAEQRQRERQGIPTGFSNKLEAAWKANILDVQSNPARTAGFAELKQRVTDFSYIRSESAAVVDRIRQGIHPEEHGPGRFYECIAADYISHTRKYGTGPLEPPFLILMRLEANHHAKQPKALQELKNNPAYHYRINFGKDIDYVNNLEFNEFMEAFVRWFLDHSTRPDYDYDFSDARAVIDQLEIPAKLLAEPFGGGKSVWTRLDNYRRQITDQPYQVRTAAQILVDDDKVLRTLKDLGY